MAKLLLQLCDQAGSETRPPMGTVRLSTELVVCGRKISVHVDAPDKRARLADIVPLAQAIEDRLRPVVLEQEALAGRHPVCHKGCDTCCTNLAIFLSVPEAFYLVDVIGELGPAARQRALDGFIMAAEKIDRSELPRLAAAITAADVSRPGDAMPQLAELWPTAGSACPMLRDHACSIYSKRLLICRSYLATSSVELCRQYRAQVLPAAPGGTLALAVLACRLEKQPSPEHVLLLKAFNWAMANRHRSEQTWRAPAMVETYLEILRQASVQIDKAKASGPSAAS